MDASLNSAAEGGRLQELCDLLQKGADINASAEDGCTALIAASFNGYSDLVCELLKHDNLDVNHQDNDGSTSLMMASFNGHSDVVAQLLKHDKIDVNLPDNEGQTALHEASSLGYFDIVFLLLEHGKVNVNLQNKEGKTASVLATENGCTEIVWSLEAFDTNATLCNATLCKENEKDQFDTREQTRMSEGPTVDALLLSAARDGNLQDVGDLLLRGSNINATDDDGCTALIAASLKGHSHIVSELLKHDKPVDVNLQDRKGHTALHQACSHGHSNIVAQLLKYDKIDVNLQDNEGQTALHEASLLGYFEIVFLLLEHGKVNVNLQNKEGKTASVLATENGRTEIAWSLEAFDTNATLCKENEKDQFDTREQAQMSEGPTVDALLISAARDGKLQELCSLLQMRANINATDEFGQSALLFASHKGYYDIVCELLKYDKVDVNLQNHYGCTALMMASSEGNSDIVLQLLKNDKVDVNIRDMDGRTSLMMASCKRHSDIVFKLLKHNKVDVNLHDNHGTTALMMASLKGHGNIVEQFLKLDEINLNFQDNDGDTALLEASSNGHCHIVFQLLKLHDKVDVNHQNKNGKTALTLATDKGHIDVVRCLQEHALKQTQLKEARDSLSSVMERAASDPVELSMEYIQHCTTDTLIGTGAFGKVYLGKDSELSKQFVVKIISFTHSEQAEINNRRRCTQREISALKRFRHPNIIALYGYSFNSNHTKQYLVYEHAANGSLDGFLRDDANRARLTADIRLSIMFELTRAVHFLHNGGCNGYRLFHRDIKSANICLAEDYTARLIDCGLAELVPIDSNTSTTSTIMNCFDTSSAIFGTPGYICPEYANDVTMGRAYSYKAACDVYAVGVVMVELILGCLIGDGQQASTDGTEHFDVFMTCVQDKKGMEIPKGWEVLKEHADIFILWTPESLDLVCDAAIRCMKPTTDGRMTTTDLLSTLRDAIHLNADMKSRNHVKPESELALCGACVQNMSSIKCDEGHVLCIRCIEIKIQRGLFGGSQVVCPFNGCSSHPFPDEYLYGRMSLEVYNLYIEKKTLHTYLGNLECKMDKVSNQFSGLTASVDNIKKDVNRNNELLEGQLKRIDKLALGLDRNMALLSWLAAEQSKDCPRLVWITPVLAATSSRNPKEWIKMVLKQKYKVVFICEHSYQPGHDPFEIEMPRAWIVKMAPWPKLCLKVLELCALCQGLPFPIPHLEFMDQCKAMNTFLDCVKEAGTSVCDRILEQSTIPTEMGRQVQKFAGDAFKFMATKANDETKSNVWKSQMIAVPVSHVDRHLMWVKNEHRSEYSISAS